MSCGFLCRYFASQGFGTKAVHGGEGMWRALRHEAHDLVVLDMGLPGPEDGYGLVRALTAHSDVGILILSARQDLIDRVVGLEIGADDYLCKPVNPRDPITIVDAS